MGITAPGNLYCHFLDHYFNLFNWYRHILLLGAKFLTQILGYNTIISDKFHLRFIGGHGVQIVYSCLGTALIGVWFAFVIAYPAKTILNRLKWLLIGFMVISFLNIIRIAALTIITNKVNLNVVDHHTYFNIAVYIGIIIMIYFYSKEGALKK